MKRSFLLLAAVAAMAFTLQGRAAQPNEMAAATAPATAPADDDEHDHAEGDDQDHDHDHDHEGHESEHEGKKQDLGKKKVGGYDVTVTQVGNVEPGKEAIFIIVPNGTGEPKAIRAWVGIDTGRGSIRTKAVEEKEGEWHAHHKVSKPLPPKSKLWIEVETSSGKQKAAYEYKQPK